MKTLPGSGARLDFLGRDDNDGEGLDPLCGGPAGAGRAVARTRCHAQSLCRVRGAPRRGVKKLLLERLQGRCVEFVRKWRIGNVRNVPEYGGGGIMDIGCYLVNTSRLIFGEEPRRVLGLIERDPKLKVDHLASMIMDFPSGHSVGTCSTQMVAHQRVNIFGATGRIEIEIPFNAPPDRPCRMLLDIGGDLSGAGIERIEFDTCDQYRIQGDLFSEAIREDTPVTVPLEDALKNMIVIEALFRSAESGAWETIR